MSFVKRRPQIPEARLPFPWIKVLLFLAVVAGAGVAYYKTVWIYRLPQERTLTDEAGHEFTARIESRAGEILKLSGKDEPGSPLLMPIKHLSEADQDFAQKLPASPALELPLAYALKGTKEYPQKVTIEGYNSTFVEYTIPSDKDLHYAQMADLDALDRAVIQEFSPNFDARYPIEYTFTDASGAKTPVRLEGRTDTMVKYATINGGTEHLTALSQLSSQDQTVLNTLPINSVTLEYPVEYTMLNNSGQKVPVSILGRSRDLVEYRASDEAEVQWRPISKLAADARILVQTLPTTLQDALPLSWKIADGHGQRKTVWVTAHNADLLQYIEPPAGLQTPDAAVTDAAVRAGGAHYLTMASLPPADAEILKLFPTGLRVSFPLTCTLTSQDGQTLKVKIIGQTHTAVRLTELPAGKTTDLAVTQLSDQDQAFLQLLPKNLKAPVATPPIPTQVQVQQQSIQIALQKIARLQKSMNQQNLTDLDKAALQKQVDATQADVERTRSLISKYFEDRVAQLQQENTDLQAQLGGDLLGPDDKAAAQDKISANTQLIAIMHTQLETLIAAEN